MKLNENLEKYKERFDQALDELSSDGNNLVVYLCRMGYPVFTEKIPTAAVGWNKKNKKIEFYFNPTFFNSLSESQFKAVICHEATHILNGHIFYFDKFMRDLKSKKSPQNEINNKIKKLNFAADCIVNDSLTNLYGVKKEDIEAVYELLSSLLGHKQKVVSGENFVGFNTEFFELKYIYSLLKDEDCFGDKSSCTIDEHSWASDDSVGSGEMSSNEDFLKAIKEFVKNNAENSSLSDKELSEIEKLSKNFGGQDAGKTQVGNLRPIDNMTKVAMNWNRLVLNTIYTKKQESTWARPNNKLISVYPDIILPVLEPEEREELFVAIDSSGSIDYNALSLFVGVVRSIPKKFKVTAISFDTQCYEYDLFSEENPRGGGGTSFSIIEEYIVNNLKKYPKNVIVLTDGYGTEVNPLHENKWIWILYGGSCESYCKNMKRHNISELLK